MKLTNQTAQICGIALALCGALTACSSRSPTALVAPPPVTVNPNAVPPAVTATIESYVGYLNGLAPVETSEALTTEGVVPLPPEDVEALAF